MPGEMDISIKLIPQLRDISRIAETLGKRTTEHIVRGTRETTRHFFRGIRAGIFGGRAEGITGFLGKILGSLALLGGSLKAIQMGLRDFISASPYLKGTFEILNKALMLFFKPFGDFLGTLLRPLAMIILKVALAFYKWIGTDLAKFVKGDWLAGLKAGLKLAITFVLASLLIQGASTFAKWLAMKLGITAIGTGVGVGLSFLLKGVIIGAYSFIAWLASMLGVSVIAAGGYVALFVGLVIGVTLIWSRALEEVRNAIKALYEGMRRIGERATEEWNKMGDEISRKLKEINRDAGKTITKKIIISEEKRVRRRVRERAREISSPSIGYGIIWEKAKEYLQKKLGREPSEKEIRRELGSYQHGGILPYTGLFYGHKGELVIPPAKIPINININASLKSEEDISLLADEISNQLRYKLSLLGK